MSILEAHRRAAAAGRVRFHRRCRTGGMGGPAGASLVASSARNMKLTTAADIELAERLLTPRPPLLEPRNGTGFDVHRFAEGDHVWLCGVKIAHTHRLEGHSDADVGLHALTDALLGAIGDGDIGQHFPPSEPAWRGAASRIFLTDAAERVAAPRRAHLERRRDVPVRGAEGRPAPACHAGRGCRHPRHRSQRASASKRRRWKGSASSAAAKASPPWPAPLSVIPAAAPEVSSCARI